MKKLSTTIKSMHNQEQKQPKKIKLASDNISRLDKINV